MRCFVIGNGPSLAETPLDLLIGEDCFTTGRIWKIFERTKWRPNYYVRRDITNMNVEQVIEDLRNMLSIRCSCYINRGWKGYFRNYFLRHIEPGNAVWLSTCHEHTHLHADSEEVPDAWHLPELCGFGSSLHVAIQLAVQKGFDEIYLLGCDLGYDRQDNHFVQDYSNNTSENTNADLIKAHEIAYKSCPVPIFNATLGGELEVYPRVDLFKILEKEHA